MAKMKRQQKIGSADAEDAGANLGGLFDSDFGMYYGEMSPAWGALLGGGLSGAGLLIAKAMRAKHPSLAKNAGFVAAAAGGIPSLACAIFFPSMRRAGYLGLAVTAIVATTELLRSMFVEPALGEYAAEMAGFGAAGLEILGDPDAIAEAMVAGALGQSPGGLEILGQSTPSQALGNFNGVYSTEMTGFGGAQPFEVSGVQPYRG